MMHTTIRIEENLEQPLETASHVTGKSKTWITNEALREYLMRVELEKQRWQDTLEALEDIQMGRVVDGEKVHAWLKSWGTAAKLEVPCKEDRLFS